MIKIIDDEVIVGIITEGNQYIPLKEPESNTFDDELIELRDKIIFIDKNTNK